MNLIWEALKLINQECTLEISDNGLDCIVNVWNDKPGRVVA